MNDIRLMVTSLLSMEDYGWPKYGQLMLADDLDGEWKQRAYAVCVDEETTVSDLWNQVIAAIDYLNGRFHD